MAITISTGTTVAIATTYGSAVTMSAITNATEAVATLAAGHGVVVGDILEVTSGWDLLNGRLVRAKTVATNDVTFESINTTSASSYPAGTGTGSIRRITAWTSVSQVQSVDTGGGEQQFASFALRGGINIVEREKFVAVFSLVCGAEELFGEGAAAFGHEQEHVGGDFALFVE